MTDEDNEFGDDRESEPVIAFGALRPIEYRQTHNLGEIIGKAVEAVAFVSMPGAYGAEPATRLFFANGSYATFVHPSNE